MLHRLAGQGETLRRAAIAGGEAQAGFVEGFGQQGDMAQPQRAAAPVLPLEFQVEVDARRIGMKGHALDDRAQRRGDLAMHRHRAIGGAGDMGVGPFQVGDLVLARRLEHAVAGVPVGLQRDFVESAVRDAADQGREVRREAGVLDRQAAAAVQPRARRGVSMSI